MEFAYSDTRTPDGWREWHLSNAEVTEAGISVATEPAFAAEPCTLPVDVIDIAVDGCQNVHVLDPDGHVHLVEWETGSLADPPILEPDANAPAQPSALSLTAATIYLVDGDDGTVWAYSRERGDVRWESPVAFHRPVAIVADRGGVSVLDKGDERGAGRLVRLDATGQAAAEVSELTAPKDLTADRTGNRYVLDVEATDDGTDASVVRTFPAGRDDTTDETATGTTISLPGPADGPNCFAAIGIEDLLIAFDRLDGHGSTACRLRVRDDDIQLIEVFDQRWSTLAAPRVYGGAGLDELYALAGGETTTGEKAESDPDRAADDTTAEDASRRFYRLEGYEKTSRNERTSEYDAQVIRRLDSGRQGTTWHRASLALARQGRRRQVRLHYCAMDDDGGVADEDPQQEIEGIGLTYGARLRASGITEIGDLAIRNPADVAAMAETSETNAEDWIHDARARMGLEWKQLVEPNPTDALLTDAEGRYLWVKIELIGNESSSPRVEAFRAYFPSRSFLRYLPAVYQEDTASEAFLERFLSIFESLFTDLEAELDEISRYMDPAGIPAAHLSWLGDWLALGLDENWPKPAKRELLTRAPDLYRRRGTRDGLLDVLRIYLEHTRSESAWQTALESDPEALADIVRAQSPSASAAKAVLGAHPSLARLSEDAGLVNMIDAWSRVRRRYERIADERQAVVDRLEDAGRLSDDAADASRQEITAVADEPTLAHLRVSDEAARPYITEYAVVLDDHVSAFEGLAETVANNPSEAALKAAQERYEPLTRAFETDRDRYERLIRTAVAQDAPYLIEAQDLDCVDSKAVRAPYAGLVDHERAFAVLLRPSVEEDRLRTARRIVNRQQPAHTTGMTVGLQPWIQLGMHSYLGVNSRLSKRELVLDRSDLGSDSVLDTREPFAPDSEAADHNGSTFIS